MKIIITEYQLLNIIKLKHNKDLINELDFSLDNTYPFEYTNNKFDNEYIFQTKNRQYSVYFMTINKNRIYMRSFRPTMSKEEQSKFISPMTKYITPRESFNDFDTLKIYATVTKITEHFILNNIERLNGVFISPLDNRRRNLVNSYIHKMNLPNNWKIIENKTGDFFILKEEFFNKVIEKITKRKRKYKDVDVSKLTYKDYEI